MAGRRKVVECRGVKEAALIRVRYTSLSCLFDPDPGKWESFWTFLHALVVLRQPKQRQKDGNKYDKDGYQGVVVS